MNNGLNFPPNFERLVLGYSLERALKYSKVRAIGNLNLNFEISNLLFAAKHRFVLIGLKERRFSRYQISTVSTPIEARDGALFKI